MKVQNVASVEKLMYSFQIGVLGTWFQNETKLSNTIAIRTEIGLCTEIWAGSGFFMAPEITLEPRWYYNIKKRAKKNLDISNNSAFFFSLKEQATDLVFLRFLL